MKVVEIIPDLTLGGAERFVVDLSNRLVSNGSDVVLITLFNSKGKKNFNNLIDSRIIHICLNKKVGFSLSVLLKLWFIIFREKPDVVHTHLNCIVYTLLSWLTMRKIKFVHTVHNDAVKEAGGRIGEKVRRYAFANKVIPVTISKESQRSFVALYNMDAPMIYNGRELETVDGVLDRIICDDIESKKNKPGNLAIINMARFAEQKNQLALVEAVNGINNKSERIDLFLVGSTDFNSAAVNICNSIEKIANNNIHILGEKENSQAYLKHCDAFCLSSLYEGMPITIIESFANGCPVLSTPVGGVCEMVKDRENGLLAAGTKKEDIQFMLERFCALSEEQRLSMKANARQTFNLFSMDTCAASYCALFAN